MLSLSDADLIDRMRFDNPWWETGEIPADVLAYDERAYFDPFFELIAETDIRRAVVLMGPRRVGKTVMMLQAIQELMARGVERQSIFFVSIDTPVFGGIRLETLFRLYRSNYGVDGPCYVFFDEIQYLKDWEIHLKSLVDSYRDVKFTVSGSAAAALRMKSRESGAGRFTEFLLPPLTFAEFLQFSNEISTVTFEEFTAKAADIAKLNRLFIDYLNYGGYPELALSETAKQNPGRYIKSDIVEKVLLRDIPSLYGVSDINELNNLFRVLAFNTAQEVSYEELAKSSQISKNTIKRYIDYLEAAFLIRTVERVDVNAKRFERNRNFKVYLTNPALRAALFGPLNADDEKIGALVETAIFAQWFHAEEFQSCFRYARWKEGEVDLVYLDPTTQKPHWAVEVKWSDRHFDRPSELSALINFAVQNALGDLPKADGDSRAPILATTRTRTGTFKIRGINVEFEPSALYCAYLGRNISRRSKNKDLSAQGELEF
jgi:predicted AAA+ superfamily ATPase